MIAIDFTLKGSCFLRLGLCLTILGLGLFITSKVSMAGECDKCPTPDVLQFDFEVTVPQPPDDAGTELYNWMRLFDPGRFATGELMDINRMCVNFFDGDSLITGKFRIANFKSFPPPPGKIDIGKDYLTTGEISKTATGYQITMVLETTCSRQTVLSASAPFTLGIIGTPHEVTGQDILDNKPLPAELPKVVDIATDTAVQLARNKFTPLLPKIREFERKLRDRDPRVAIDAFDGLLMEPAKHRAKPGETVPITFTLTDCDGEPLRNRVISLTSSSRWSVESSHNGSFKTAAVTTDDAGKVKVDFILGSAPGNAIARAYFEYNRPSGCEFAGYNETVINVEGARQYQGKATFVSPIGDASAVANVTWTLVEKQPGEDEVEDEDEDNHELRYAASGTISGDISLPDCDPKHYELTLKPDDGGELAIYPNDNNYSFEFSSEAEVTLMCGKPRQPFVIWGASFLHFVGGLCGMEEGLLVPYKDLKTLKGEEKCETGVMGTTSWEFNAAMK